MTSPITTIEPGNSFETCGRKFNVLRVTCTHFYDISVIDWDYVKPIVGSKREFSADFSSHHTNEFLGLKRPNPGERFCMNPEYDGYDVLINQRFKRVGMFVGQFRCCLMLIDTVNCDPVNKHVLKKSEIKTVPVISFLEGEKKLYSEFIKSSQLNCASPGVYGQNEKPLDTTDAVITSNNTIKPIGDVSTELIKEFHRTSLISYVLAVNGPTDAVSLLRQTALVQGKPYVPNANTSYLKKFDTFVHVAGEKSRSFYSLTVKGMMLASGVISKIGHDPARLALDFVSRDL